MHLEEKSVKSSAYLVLSLLLVLNLALYWMVFYTHIFHEVGDEIFLFICAIPLAFYVVMLYPKGLFKRMPKSFKEGIVFCLYLGAISYLIIVFSIFFSFLSVLFSVFF